jgi:hypothetical protein
VDIDIELDLGYLKELHGPYSGNRVASDKNGVPKNKEMQIHMDSTT